MPGHHLSQHSTASTHPPLRAYLDDIAARLTGPRRRRRQILAELHDGLHHATDRLTTAGTPADQAAATAIAQFGTPTAVAAAFADELTTAYARRTIALYLITGPLVGICWLLLLHPTPRQAGPTTLLATIPVLPLIALATATAGATLATTGRLIRWLPETTPPHALTATLTIAALATATDLTMLGLLAATHRSTSPLAITAITASTIRTASSIAVTRTTTRLRRAATQHDPH
jgi:hypothetical protein